MTVLLNLTTQTQIMKILIAGTGDTAMHLAKMLSRENQDVVVMGKETDALNELDSRYNILTCEGNPVTPSSLRKAGAPGCDLFIAVTPFENHNLVACELAKWMGATRTLARIDNEEWLDTDTRGRFTTLGIDEMVYPERLAALEISRALHNPWLRGLYPLHSGMMSAGAVRICPGAPLSGTLLRDFDKNAHKIHICAIKREGETIIPGGNDSLNEGDIVYFTASPEADWQQLRLLFGKRTHNVHHIMVAGGGKMAEAVVPLIEKEYSVTVIDPDRQVCDRLASRCERATVVCADFREVDVLREEGIKRCEAFIALSPSAEKNIVSSLVARSLGVATTIAQIEDIQYFSEADDLNIDVVINKKLLTSSTIYQMLLDCYLHSPRCLAFEAAEVAEIVAHEGSSITRKPVRDLKLDNSMTIAAVVHEGHGMLVDGNTRIVAGDSVVVFCLRGHLKHVQRLFS